MKSLGRIVKILTISGMIIFFSGCYYGYQSSDSSQWNGRGGSSYSKQPGEEITEPQSAVSAIVIRKAKQYNVDPIFLKSLIEAESSWRSNAVSYADCHGLTQLSMPTARQYIPTVNRKDLHDPETNVDIACRHLLWLQENVDRHFGYKSRKQKMMLIAAAWNAGWNRVLNAGGIPSLEQTRRLAEKVMTNYRKYQYKGSYQSGGRGTSEASAYNGR